ncbi:MAG: iron-containing alcohol dehydrogenase [Oscillospiraceae bacterium]|jgi:alcohol dehydrogenase YqhD (iron-dependent ADH family)|nr:iron-containing alcohol dehydrogenase [Oscillospiraceae bacterium]
MLNFDFHIPTRIVFGKGAHLEIGALLAPHAKKVLLHYGGQSVKKSGVYDEITASLRAAGIAFAELGGVQPNPRVTLVREGVALARREGVDLILAVGGGSVIDSSKGIAAGFYHDGDVWELYGTFAPVLKALPVAAVLTIPAAGSESSGASVVSDEEKELKSMCAGPALYPLLSVVNPELFYTLPKHQVTSGIADIMSHVFERYFTNTTHTDLTDGLCEATLRAILRNAPRVVENPLDYDAWCQIGLGGTIAHNDILGLGRAQDWGSHIIEHELSALYDVTHGAGLAVLTPAWMRYVYKDNINMFVQFATNVMGVQGSFRDPEALVLEGIARLRRFFDGLGLPATLTALGVGGDKLEFMAKHATGAESGDGHPIGGLKPLFWRDVLAILESVR